MPEPTTEVNIKFTGPPGSGKSLCLEYVKELLSIEDFKVIQVDDHELQVTLNKEDKDFLSEQ